MGAASQLLPRWYTTIQVDQRQSVKQHFFWWNLSSCSTSARHCHKERVLLGVIWGHYKWPKNTWGFTWVKFHLKWSLFNGHLFVFRGVDFWESNFPISVDTHKKGCPDLPPRTSLQRFRRQGTRNWLGEMGSPRWGPRSGLAKPSWEKNQWTL